MKPQTEVFKIETSNLICLSGGIGGTPSNPAKAPVLDDWDEVLGNEEMTNSGDNSLLF